MTPESPPSSIAPARLSGKSWHLGHQVLMPEGRRAHRAKPVRRISGTLLLAAVIGIGCGVFDLMTGRSDTTGLFVATAGFALALMVPSGAVARAVIMGVSIPLVYFVATLLEIDFPYPPTPHYLATIIALVPALAGTLFGLGVRRLASGGTNSRLRP